MPSTIKIKAEFMPVLYQPVNELFLLIINSVTISLNVLMPNLSEKGKKYNPALEDDYHLVTSVKYGTDRWNGFNFSWFFCIYGMTSRHSVVSFIFTAWILAPLSCHKKCTRQINILFVIRISSLSLWMLDISTWRSVIRIWTYFIPSLTFVREIP